MNGVALGAVMGGALLALDSIAPGLLQTHGLVPVGVDAATTYSMVLATAFVAAGLGLARRLAGRLVLRSGR
jgi:hypothetical protein